MAGTPTPNYNWPIPALTDPPDGPGQIGALGNAIDTTVKAIDNVVRTPNVSFAPTWTGLTIGNAAQSFCYRLLGSHLAIYGQVTAAASAPTTVFTAGECAITIPAPYTYKAEGYGTAQFINGSWPRASFCFTGFGNKICIRATRAADALHVFPLDGWGAAWVANAYLAFSIIIPI